jgi:hypothetical protein
MKMQNPTKRLIVPLLMIAAMAVGVTATFGQQGQIGARALTPQEIKDYALPATTQVSGGLFTVGLGQPVYLEAQVRLTIADSNIFGVTWELTSKPIGSSAALAASPLPPTMPIYNPGDRGFFKVASRQLLRPDVEGQYLVTATVATNGGNLVLTQRVTGATYLGVGVCQLCHSGGFVEDNKVGPWSKTHHSMAFTNNIDGWTTDHFNQNCIKCHSVGYDANALAVNGGFDDVQTQTGWTFPASLTNGNFLAMPQALRDKANVQCESCHGPGSQHFTMFGSTNHISVSFSAGDCAQCHDAEPYHVKGVEWANSLHAVATRTPTGEARAACVRCHAAMGFTDYAEGLPQTQQRTAYEAITCAACHDPHGDANNPHLLRKMDAVALMDNKTVITGGGKGQLCMNCHMGRRDATNYVETTTGSAQFGPHHGPQADMLAGVNAITYGKEIPSSAHFDAVKDTCVACHLQEVAGTAPGFGNVGGHTFRPGWDGDTPSDPADDVHLVELCSDCHGDIESFDFKRADYDGDGTIQGVQTEVKGLLAQLGNLLPPAGPGVTVNSSFTKQQLKAAFNYLFVLEDGSYGAHNLSYAVGLLKASIVDLTDDADHDGLSDKWEIANFGTITSYDGNDDPDNDGVNNSLEMSALTNPLLADTDGDGVNDLAELQAGSDPLNSADKPGLVVKIFGAAEVEFASEVGKKYQVQRVSELTGAWLNEGSVTNGTGSNISMVTSTRTGGSQAYFRVVQVP